MQQPKNLGTFLLVFAICQVSAFMAGSVLQFSNGFSAFWAPTGVCLVGLILAPFRWWLPLLILQTGVDTVATAANFDVFVLPDDSIKVGLAAYYLKRVTEPEPYSIKSLKSFVQMLLACALSFATVAVYSAPSSELWLGYWMGDLLGVTMVAPLFFLEHAHRKDTQKFESVITLLVFLIVTRAVFLSSNLFTLSPLEYPYILFPLLLWVSIRLPDRVVAISTISVAALAVYYTGQNMGPFLALPVSPTDQLLILQIFLLILTTGPVFLSLTVYERKSAAGASRRYRADQVKAERVYQLLFETSGVSIGILKNRKLVKMNRKFSQLFGAELGTDPLLLSPPLQLDGTPSQQRADELHQKCKAATVTSLWTARVGGPEDLVLDLTLFTLPDAEEVILTAVDVTKSHRLVELLQKERQSLAGRVEMRSAELLQANADLARSVQGQREFVAHLSHELKAPLTALMAHSETLLEGLFGPLNEEQRNAINDLRNNGERLSRLVLDLLDLNRLEARQYKIVQEPFLLQDLINEAVAKITSLKDRSQIHLELKGDFDQTVVGDRALCTKAVTLLLSRAARQTPEGGSFGLSANLEENGDYLELVVWDQGPAIPEQTLLTLEDPYAYRWEVGSRSEHGITFAVAARFLQAGGANLMSDRSQGENQFTLLFPTRSQL